MSLPLGARFASMALLSRRDAELVRCGRESARRLGLESEWGVRARMRRRRPTRRASGQHRARDQAARTGLGRGASTVVKIGMLPVRGCDTPVSDGARKPWSARLPHAFAAAMASSEGLPRWHQHCA